MIVKQKKINKPWGFEIIWSHCDKFVGKILHINKGHKLSRQYHKIKEETIIVQQGLLTLELGAKQYKKKIYLGPGESFHITPNTVHRFCADKNDAVLYEVSTPELNDVIRIEDDYDRTK